MEKITFLADDIGKIRSRCSNRSTESAYGFFFPFNFRKHSNLKCTRLCEKRRKKMLGMRILTVKKNVCSNEKNVMRQSSNDRSFRGAAVVRRIVEPTNTTHPNQVNTKGKR